MKSEGGEIQDSLDWLAGHQARNGSFVGAASSQIVPFNHDKEHATAFFTSLILIALQEIPGNQKIVQKGLDFIKSQQSSIGSWNYWDRQSNEAQRYPFPDDLDDTACALLALSIHDPSYVDGSILAKLVQLLIASEIQPGGPYRTWLVEPRLYKDWGDTDLAVNANIASLLDYHGVRAPGLEDFASMQLRQGSLGSRYYLGDAPSLYFLSRWHKSPEMKRYVTEAIEDIKDATEMEAAMLLTAGCRLKLAKKHLKPVYLKLLKGSQDNHWAAAALYIELTVDGTIYYAGSESLTTALSLEAISLYQKPTNETPQPVSKKSQPAIYKQIVKSSAGMPPKLKKPYLDAVKSLVNADKQGQIINMAGITAQAFGLKIRQGTLTHLNLGSLNGWTAYSIYDDFYDDEAEASLLSAANHALRHTVIHYQAALPGKMEFRELVLQALDIIDAANQWEVQNARGQLKEGLLVYVLPSYGNYSKLAERSWGHMLAATGTLMVAGYESNSAEIQNIQKFFYHYLIARQLNDDAHDWYDDLEKGHLSAVVTILLQRYKQKGPIDLKAEMKELQTHFWQHSIKEVSVLANKHLKAARRALKSSGASDQHIFLSWLDSLEQATNKAVEGSQQAKKFIDSYSGNQSKIK